MVSGVVTKTAESGGQGGQKKSRRMNGGF